MFMAAQTCLTSEAVQSASLSFQSVHDVHGGDGLFFFFTQINRLIRFDPNFFPSSQRGRLSVSDAASQFAYLYYVLKVCTLFVKKKYILLSM